MTEVSGWHPYRGTTVMQHEDIKNKLTRLFDEVKPSQVLEIGTSHGGLTLMIRDVLDELSLTDTYLRSYDIIPMDRYWLDVDILNGKQIELLITQIFNNTYEDLIESEIENQRNFVQREGRTIVMCDGGMKKNEFKIFSKFLKKGDIIMAHDYSPTKEYFEEFIYDKIWNWHEIQDSDIENSVIENNLKPYLQDEFQKVVWVCKIKE